jgi:hypothetical protein
MGKGSTNAMSPWTRGVAIADIRLERAIVCVEWLNENIVLSAL